MASDLQVTHESHNSYRKSLANSIANLPDTEVVKPSLAFALSSL